MAAANTDKFKKAKRRFSTTVGVGGFTAGATTLPLTSTSGLDTDTAITLVIEPGGINEEVITGVVNGSNVINCVRGKEGTSDVTHTAGAAVSMYFTETHWDDLINGILVSHNQDGTLANNAITTASITDGVVTNAKLNSDLQQGWINLNDTPETITYNGNRNYDLVFNSTDLTSTLSTGMRLKLTRTVAAPYRCTTLNGSTQYFSKSSPNKCTFTSTYSAMGWVKLNGYSNGAIIGRDSATATGSGWEFFINSVGQPVIYGRNASGNIVGTSYISIPLNRWVHVAGTMNAATGSAIIYINGVAVTTNVSATGTTIVQASTNLTIGKRNSGSEYFNGQLAQIGLFSSVLSASDIKSYYSQGLSGSEANTISSFSFDNSITDLNTTTPNDLTASGSAVATTADSPFANAVTSGTLEYGLVQSVTYSTNTTVNVQVPEGCAIPTSGGISSVYYSIQKNPYKWISSVGRWKIIFLSNFAQSQNSPTANTWYSFTALNFVKPTGAFEIDASVFARLDGSTTDSKDMIVTFSNTGSAPSGPMLSSEYFFLHYGATIRKLFRLPKFTSDTSSASTFVCYMECGGASLSAFGTYAYARGGNDYSGTTITLTPSNL